MQTKGYACLLHSLGLILTGSKYVAASVYSYADWQIMHNITVTAQEIVGGTRQPVLLIDDGTGDQQLVKFWLGHAIRLPSCTKYLPSSCK